MKQHTEILLQTSQQSPPQLRTEIKQNDKIISQINASIRRKRSQMKQFSQSMTKALQKKLIPKRQSLYNHPNFKPQFQSSQLKILYSQKEKIYVQIAKLKEQISGIIAQEQPQVMNQYKRKQSIIQNLNKNIISYKKQKQLLEQQLTKNKQKLDEFKASQCLKQIQQNQQQLQEIKIQIRDMEKQMRIWMDQEIGIGMYQRKIQEHIKEIQKKQNQDKSNQVDSTEIQGLCEEIRRVLEDKKIAQRQHALQKEQLMKKMRQIAIENDNIQTQIRKIDSQTLQQQLQKKRKESLIKSNSMPQISKKQPLSSPLVYSKPQSQSQIQPQDNYLPSLLLTEPRYYIKQSQTDSQQYQQIVIGYWNQQNKINDDLIQNSNKNNKNNNKNDKNNNNISRAINMKIKTKNKKIIGIAVLYVNKIGVQIMGRSNIWANGNQELAEGQQEYNIDLDQISAICYTNSSNNNKSIGIKFIPKLTSISQKPSPIKLGEFLNEQQQQHELQTINLQHKIIKFIQFTLDSTYTIISGIRLTIIKGEIENYNGSKNINQNESTIRKHVKRLSNQELGKWSNLSQTGGLTHKNNNLSNNKKVYLKSNKKLDQIQQKIDHRLMLNRKRKIV